VILEILERTPRWVLVVFCALVALGLSQTRPRDVSRAHATVLPALMVLLSLYGVLGAFSQPALGLAAWVAGFGVCQNLAGGLVGVRGASWSSETRYFRVPGSWVPVSLILGLFVIKYVAGVSLAIRPSLAANSAVVLWLSFFYGVFAGLFWGRARSLLALARDRI
jgi:hypothetical protein